MLATLQAKLISLAVGAALLFIGGGAAYVGYVKYEAEKAAVDTANAALAVEKANAAAAQKQADALASALNTQKQAATAGTANRVAAGKALSAAVAVSPAVASTVVPESYWQAIYGAPANAATK